MSGSRVIMAPIPTVATRIPVEPRTLGSPSKAGGATAPHALLLRTAGATATAAAAHPNTLRTLLLSASKPPSVLLSAFPPSETPIFPPVSIGFFPDPDSWSLISPIVPGFGDGRLPARGHRSAGTVYPFVRIEPETDRKGNPNAPDRLRLLPACPVPVDGGDSILALAQRGPRPT